MPPNPTLKMLKAFERLYPDPHSELNFFNEYQMIVCVMLSAQCTDRKVNQTTPPLFKRYPSFESLSRAGLKAVEALIRPINYYKTKSRNIIAMADKIVREYGGSLPRTIEALTSLPGVGRKTANVILCEQGEIPALPVDTHVFRLSRRLGLSTGAGPDEVEDDLKSQFKPEIWYKLHHWLVLHGRRVCKAQRPLCADCALLEFCPAQEAADTKRRARSN